MAAAREPGIASWLFSAILHLLVLLCLWWSAAPQKLDTPPPLAVELWAGGAPAQPAEPAPPSPAPVKPAPAPVPKVAPPPMVADNPAADVKLQAAKPDKIKPEATPKPPPPKPEPVKAAKPETKPEPRPDNKAKPAAAANPAPASKTPAKPAPGVKTDDLLAELDSLPPGPGNAKASQAGAKVGSKSGAANGQPDLKQQYGESVRNRVRPYVVLPDGIKGNPEAVVEVIILPTLEIRSSRILRSSGSPAWDQAVLAALAEVKRFPPLPKGADFADYRRITLNFRPKE